MERIVKKLKYGFKFAKFDTEADVSKFVLPEFDDSNWQQVRVPHDWAIDAEFEMMCDAQESSIKEDGVLKPILHTGRTGALPSVAKGVYRKWIDFPESDCEKKIFLQCDGIMWRSEIYVNGVLCKSNHFGYKSYEADITDAVKYGKSNLICIVATVDPDCSRWYSGGGIYRNLYIVKKPQEHIPYCGVWIKQRTASEHSAVFEVKVETKTGFNLKVYSPDNQEIISVATESDSEVIEIENPTLWDVESPNLYRAEITLGSGDSEVIRFGARFSEFTRDGYFLNGRKLKLNGVCMHHDLGSLGAAINLSALKRQLRILREMGVNAIRTSHNPPAPELLDLCDEQGFVVMDEFFDEWQSGKIRNGYAKYFNEHAYEDMEDIIKRDRNHPCVIIWSTGNEMREQWKKDGWKLTGALTDAVHAVDPTRPVTAGLSAMPQALDNKLPFFIDVASFNYKPHLYKELQKKYPNLMYIGSETASCVSTRGVYRLPAKVEIPAEQYDELACSAYELAAPHWAYYAERELAAQQDCDYVAGEFVWTGFDYLGEPTPYYDKWPSRSSYFGIVDLAGLPKNRFYLYKSVWTNKPVLHVFPHWNWAGYEGKNVPVHVFTNFPKVELFINGKSQGIRHLEKDGEISRFRLTWDDAVYQPGEVLAVAFDKDGNKAMTSVIKTAGEPYAIKLCADRNEIIADGDDLCYVTASIVDKDGNLCPTADNRLTFEVMGNGEFLTTDAGDQRETESFTRPDKKALSGMLVACIRSTEQNGEISIKCASNNLICGEITIKSIKNKQA